MKINFTQPILTLEGNPRQEITLCEVCQATVSTNPLTLRRAVISAMNTPFSDEKNLDPVKKFARGELAYRIFRNDELELTAEEITMLKKLTGKLYVSSIVFEIHNMLENKPIKSKPTEGEKKV